MSASPRLHVGVAGGGLMGVGVAAIFAAHGHRVTVLEPDGPARDRLDARLQARLEEVRQPWRSEDPCGRMQAAGSVAALAGADIVVEAAPEVLGVKRELYRDLFDVLGPTATVASTTSTFLPDRLAEGLEEAEAARLLVAHFWNPPHYLPLVEVVAGSLTGPGVVDRIVALLADIGSEPVVLRDAAPGFIGNRLQFAVLREALHLIELGLADAETVERVFHASLGRRWTFQGPLESADLGGLPTILRVARELGPSLATETAGIGLLERLVAAGRTGSEAGAGLLEWTEERRTRIFATGHPRKGRSLP